MLAPMRKGHFLRFLMLWLVANSLFGQQLPFLLVPGGPANIGFIFQDHLGRLWVTAPKDVQCFDGTRFYSLHDFGFPSAGVTAITEDSEGAIWIGSEAGLYRFHDGALTRLMAGRVQALAASSGIVVASVFPDPQNLKALSLFRIRCNRSVWEAEQIMDLKWNGLFTLDHAEKLLIPLDAAWGELAVRDIVDWHKGVQLSISNKHTSRPRFAIIFSRDRLGCVWSRTRAFTTYQCPGDPEPIELPSFIGQRGSAMHEDSAGNMLFLNNGSLVMGRPGRFRTFTLAQGLPDVNAAITGFDGTVWLGGPKGLYRWPQPGRLEYWTAREGFAGLYRICRVGDKIFAGNGQEGISVLSDDRARWLALPKSKALGVVLDLIPDLQGGLFAGLRVDGLARVRADGTIDARAGQHLDYFARLAFGSDGQLWAAGSGISRVKQAGGHRLVLEALPAQPTEINPGNQGVDIALERTSGKLWACWTSAVLSQQKHSAWQTILTRDGRHNNYCGPLTALPGGDVWVADLNLSSFALLRLDADGKATEKRFLPIQEGSTGIVTFLEADARGWLWRGTQNGIFVANPKDAENSLWTRLDEVDGLPNSATNILSFSHDADGSVWWSTRDSALVHFSPAEDFVHPAFAPKLFVASFSTNGGPAKLAEAVSAVPAGSNITAHVGSTQFDRRNALRLRYRVLPQQTAWKESHDLDVPLGVLSWGDHNFEAQARLGTGPWSGTTAHAFKVLRPFWATWPFLIGFAAAGIGAGFGGYRFERRRRRIASRRLPDLRALRVDAITPEAHAFIDTALDGRFVPTRVLARGGFATVFDGRDKRQNCRCAIKVFHREVADQGLARRFAQEVAALQAVVHPNVVRIYGQGETPLGVPYLVMEFVEGRTLREAIPPGGLPPREVASLLRQAGSALAAIHARGICHRDLKPDNLMIRERGPAEEKLVLIDFSIAIVKSPDKTVHGLSRAAGTIQYMAPEQAVGWANESSDIYSLAKVAMEMITGHRLTELLPEASRDLSVRVKEFLAGLPLRLSRESIDLIGGALEFDPERRPRDAMAFADKVAGDLEG